MEHILIGQIDINAGWITMVLGLISGSILGLWAFAGPFPTPPGHENYTDLARRMVRLGHIALVALPIICILYGHHIDSIPVSDQLKHLGAVCIIICMIGVPSLLFLASVYLPFKYVEIIPVSAGILALAIMSYGHILML